MQKRFDPTLKGLLERSPEMWPPLIGQPPAPVTVIDADVSTVTAASDKVLRVHGDPDWLLDVNFQSGPDASVPQRLHLYNTMLGNRHGLLVRSVVVLLAPRANLNSINGQYEEGFPGEEPYLRFRYQVIRLWEQPASSFLEGGLGLLPLAPLASVTEADLPGVVARMQERLGGHEPAIVAEMWTATQLLMGLRWQPTLFNRLLEGIMSLENDSWVYQAIMEKGALREARQILLLQGAKRFGPPDPAVKAAIEGTTDLERLHQWLLRRDDVNSWQELLA